MLKSLFGVFSGAHRVSWSAMHAIQGEFERQKETIVQSLREHCPPKQRAFFEESVAEVFGPSLAEIGPAEKSTPDEVAFKKTETKQGPMGVTQTYEVHTARSKAAALAFLEGKSVRENYYYVIVETPEGNWGKDKMGVFEE